MKRFLFWLYPAGWRDRYGDELESVMEERQLTATIVADVLLGAMDAHLHLRRPPGAHDRTDRVLGVAGILGGLFLLAAFVVAIPSEVNSVRILALLVAPLAVVVGFWFRLTAGGRLQALVATVPALLGNGAMLTWQLFALGRPHPFAGHFGLVGFYLSLVWWLGNAWFGAMILRLGGLARVGAVALALGSPLALLGIDRIGLTSARHPTIFGPISLLGIGLNGIGWILLGIELVLSARDGRPTLGSKGAD